MLFFSVMLLTNITWFIFGWHSYVYYKSRSSIFNFYLQSFLLGCQATIFTTALIKKGYIHVPEFVRITYDFVIGSWLHG